MIRSFTKYHNKLTQLYKAIQFHQFSFKLLQIRAAEQQAKYITPTRFYKQPVLPKDIVIRITERCFLNCKICAQGGERGRVDQRNLKTGPVEIETLKKIAYGLIRDIIIVRNVEISLDGDWENKCIWRLIRNARGNRDLSPAERKEICTYGGICIVLEKVLFADIKSIISLLLLFS